MQEYFKYDKIQEGAPLFMKSDSDGSKDKDNQELALGIKTVPEGVKHFTNWDEISNSIDANGGIRFDDAVSNSIRFSMPHRKSSGTIVEAFGPNDFDWVGARQGYELSDSSGTNVSIPNSESDEVSFIDSWEANDINIIDDIAFVSYEDYTDIHRKDINLGTNFFVVPQFRGVYSPGYDMRAVDRYDVGSLVMSTKLLPRTNAICPKVDSKELDSFNVKNDYDTSNYNVALSNSFASYDNTILKVVYNNKTLYFTYGGAKPRREFTISRNRKNAEDAVRTSGTPSTVNIDEASDGDYCGHFYIVTHNPITQPRSEFNQHFQGTKEEFYKSEQVKAGDYTTHIEIPFTTTNDEFGTNTGGSNAQGFPLVGDDARGIGVQRRTYNTTAIVTNFAIEAEVTLIKIQPVRKCGKVDVYVRKTGIITAAVSNRFTSPGHNLNTNDMVKISSALFDGTEEGAVDIHPLNGDKFVKKIDDDTFDLYDDQFFEQPTSTNKLKTTDGIVWTCISSSNGQFGQSWDYHKTILSPTGRNGYTSKEADTKPYDGNFTASSSNFTTSNRVNKVFFGNDNIEDTKIRDEYSQSTVLNFSSFSENAISLSGLFGKKVAALLDSIPVSTFDKSALDIANKAPHDFYPYDCKSEDDTGNFSPYNGSKFGCSLDAKFSHKSGESRVYTVAIGERGSEVSLNVFGCMSSSQLDNDSFYDREFLVDGGVLPYAVDSFQYNTSEEDGVISKYNIHKIYRERVLPFFMPHGKVHLISITVDKYGRVTDISHKNTLLGDGSSLNASPTVVDSINRTNRNSDSQYPWAKFLHNKYNSLGYFKYFNDDLPYMDGSSGTIDSDATLQITASISSFFKLGKSGEVFDESFQQNSSQYWDRAAIAHWLGAPIYDYWNNSVSITSQAKKLTDSSANRHYTLTDENSPSSYFGTQLSGETARRYKKISRFGQENNQWFICPWVDSFGKSVALSDIITVTRSSESDTNFMVFGSATTRSNISVYPESDRLQRPIVPKLSHSESLSEIGQITCSFIRRKNGDDEDYKPVQILEINSGGSVDSSLYSVLNKNQDTTTTVENATNQRLIKLRKSNLAGLGHKEVVSSSYLSANTIKYKDSHLIWADQCLYSQKSSINILKFDDTNKNKFTTVNEISQKFTTLYSSEALFVGDGFGMNIRLGGDILVTNGMKTTNDLGDDIGTTAGAIPGSYRLDSLFVYKLNYNTSQYSFVQNINPTLDKNQTEKYGNKILNDFEDYLIDANHVNYSNSVIGSLSWNIKLLNRYDTVSDKILLRDPIEYVLFGFDHSIADSLYGSRPDLTSTSVSPYLYFTEHFEDNTVYYDYSTKDSFLLRDASRWEEFGTTQNKIRNIENSIKTPVFFLDIPSFGFDRYGNISIKIRLGDDVKRIINRFDLTSLLQKNILNDLQNQLIPRLVLYKKDPRSMIVPNGPATSASNTDIVPFTNGIFDYGNNEIDINGDYYQSFDANPPLFRGGANDMHFYGSLAGTAPEISPKSSFRSGDFYQEELQEDKDFLRHYYGGEKNLGELFDITYNKAGNTGKGIISWASPDMFSLITKNSFESINNLFPYAALFSSTISNFDGTYTFSIPFNTWKNYAIKGDLLKSSSDNRPFFDSFDRIKQGSLSSNQPFAGNWDKTFDDINRASYNPKKIIDQNGNTQNILPSLTLAVGFVITSINDVDIRNRNISTGSFSLQTGRNFRGVIERHSKYPYSKSIADSVADPYFTGGRRTQLISHELQSQIQDISFSVDRASMPQRKIKPSFNKVAYFKYNNQAYSEVQKSIIYDSIGESSYGVERYAFGRFAFTPLPIGLPSADGNGNDISAYGNVKNPIIRVGSSKANFGGNVGNKGTFSKSIQVLSSDSLYNQARDVSVSNNTQIESYFYIKDNDDKIYTNIGATGVLIGAAIFKGQTLLGGFDIEQPEFVSLNIDGRGISNQELNLHIKNSATSGNVPFFVSGIGGFDTTSTLWVGQGIIDVGLNSSIKTPDAQNNTSLYISEPQPSSIIPMSISTPDVTNDISLSFAQVQKTGALPLSILPPTQQSGQPTLNIDGQASMLGSAPLRVRSLGIQASGLITYVSGVSHVNNNVPLVMNIPDTGVVPLSVGGTIIPSTGINLSIGSLEKINSNISLHVGPEFKVTKTDTTLFVDTERHINKNADLLIRGDLDSVDSIRNGESDFTLKRNNNLIDISETAELPVSVTFDGRTTTSNSITRRNIAGDVYVNKTLNTKDTQSVFGAYDTETSVNVALKTKNASLGGSRIGRAFYSDESSDFSKPLKIIKRNLCDSNGSSMIACSVKDGLGQFDIYDIVDNSKITLNSSLFVNLTKPVIEPEAFTTSPIVYKVTVVKAVNEYGAGNKFYINGQVSPELSLKQGKTYRFDLSDSTLLNHPLRFSSTPNGTHDGGSPLSKGISIVGTPGTAGAYSQITIMQNKTIHYYCKHHSGMGAVINVLPNDANEYNLYGDTIGGDSFIDIRRELKNKFNSNFIASDLIPNDCEFAIRDVKLAKTDIIAISCRVKLRYSNSENDQTKIFNVILLYNLVDVEQSYNDSYRASTHIVTNYYHHILEESGELQNKSASGYSIDFCNKDLYFDRRSGGFGSISKLSHEDSYASAVTVADFNANKDSKNYINTNGAFIVEENRRAAFGVPIKIYDDYYSDGKIMFVGAHLFDPFTFNTLTAPYDPSPVGAVYIYKQSLNSNDWTYFGAVYGKGNTSLNVTSNLSDYSDVFDANYGLFGYDFDYMEGRLVVSEPGGDGQNPINSAKAYLFNIDDSISLFRTYDSSSLSLTADDSFGSSIILLNSENPISFDGNGIIYSLKSESAFNASLAYAESSITTEDEANENIVNENKNYDPVKIKFLGSSSISRSVDLLDIKKLDFGGDIINLAAIRQFKTTLNNKIQEDFKLQKLFIENLEPQAFGLFISGPVKPTNTATLVIPPIGINNAEFNLAMPVVDSLIPNTFISLSIASANIEDNIPLNIATVGNNITTVAMSGSVANFTSDLATYIEGRPFHVGDIPVYVSGADTSSIDAQLAIQGGRQLQFVGLSTLHIGKDTRTIQDTSLYVNAIGAKNPNYTFLTSDTNFSISGSLEADNDVKSPLFISAPNQRSISGVTSLHTSTDIPPISPRGFYICSGDVGMVVAGNNNASVFSAGESFATLHIQSSEAQSGVMPLYIDVPAAKTATLSIRNQNATGVVPASVEGANLASGVTTLLVKPPSEITTSLEIRGYLE